MTNASQGAPQTQQKAIWYYTVADQQKGPVTTSSLVQLYKTGTIKSDTLIWRQGFTDWKPFSQFLKGGSVAGKGSTSAQQASSSSSLGKIIAIMAAAAVIIGGGAFAALHAIPSNAPTSSTTASSPSSANGQSVFDTVPAGADSAADVSSASTASTTAVVSEGVPSVVSSTNPFVQEPFDPDGSVKPKIIPTDTPGKEEIIDADGTETFPSFHNANSKYVFPDKSSFYVDLFEPDLGDEDAFFTLPGVTPYEIGNWSGDTSVTQSNDSRLDQPYEKKQDLGSGQTMFGVMNKIQPTQNPAKTVDNHILDGTYQYIEKLLVGNVTASLNFNGSDLTLQIPDLGLNNEFGYKFEPLGKNAYRLFLYGRSVENKNGKEVVSYTAVPVDGRPFFIYMDAKDKFDFVYFSDINRYSVTMTKSNTGG